MKAIYLDHCATTPLRPEVWEAMLPLFRDRFGNPSSVHAYGKAARETVEDARSKVASLIGAKSAEIVFTGGGTESDNLAIRGAADARKGQGRHIITSAVEHLAVLETCRDLERSGFMVTYLPVDGEGRVDPAAVKGSITDETILVSIMHANNEIGTIEPIEAIGRMTRERGILLHTDAVQSVGKIPVDVRSLQADLLSLSGHKINGPKGVGALYVREGVEISPVLTGGHQEKGRRGGTENVPAVAGLGRACELAGGDLKSRTKELKRLRDLLQAKLADRFPGLRVNGHEKCRLPHVLSVSFRGLPAEEIVQALDREGVAVSAGSACTSGRREISHVIAAIGVPPEEAPGTVRLSVGWGSSPADIREAADLLASAVGKIKALQELEASVGGRKCC
ncbi:MAG TPA: cysteine desulfurase family protein [Syntrophales bacterium]|nr:cysteine desulfurase family protein [Syntrophales bacterium]HRT61909.1 cysteine desulfurase family protein [Syntrophales bacterium]